MSTRSRAAQRRATRRRALEAELAGSVVGLQSTRERGPRRRSGRAVAVGNNCGDLLVFDALTRRPIARRHVVEFPTQVVRYSPDGTRLALASSDGVGAVLDLLDWRSYRRIAHHQVDSVERFAYCTFSPDSRGHAGIGSITSFSPDGRTLATTSADGTTRLSGVASTRPIGRPLPGEPNTAGGAHFVAAAPSSPRSTAAAAPTCRRARVVVAAARLRRGGRPLTRAEWEEALPRREYRAGLLTVTDRSPSGSAQDRLPSAAPASRATANRLRNSRTKGSPPREQCLAE